ncbi:DUF2911 domain-containing protein [Cryomorphaceae bacterium]|nr:DUF2911 domain-containing protein [Cryomorphaceae bacterium]
MIRFLKWLVIALVALIVLLFGAYKYMQSQTKKHSPEEIITMTVGDGEVEVFYNRPYKKDREIFGALVPYGEVWRTGANEASTFSTTTDIKIEGQSLPAGKYTLWTIPDENEWTVIWNSKMYSWGVDWEANAQRKAEFDVLQVKVPVLALEEEVEQFTIRFSSEQALILEWDQVQVSAQITP